MSKVFGGGFEYMHKAEPQTDEEVLEILQSFIRDRFDDPSVADEITEDRKHFIIHGGGKFDVSSSNFGEIVANGAFSYAATDHAVQTIWENQFEIRSNGNKLFVYVSDWLGTTPETWNEKVEREQLYV